MGKLRLKETEAERGTVNWQIGSNVARIQAQVHQIQTLVGHTSFCSELAEWTARLALSMPTGIRSVCSKARNQQGLEGIQPPKWKKSWKERGRWDGAGSGPDSASRADKGYNSPAEPVFPTPTPQLGTPGALWSGSDNRGHLGNAATGKALWTHQERTLCKGELNKTLGKSLFLL